MTTLSLIENANKVVEEMGLESYVHCEKRSYQMFFHESGI